MRNFQFNPKDTHENVEDVLKYRKQKIAKQQLIFTLFLLLITGIIGAYIVRKVTYTELDGFIQVDLNTHRSPDDIFLMRMMVEPGDFILPGDTLYSYMYLNSLLEHINSNNEPDVINRSRDARMKYAAAKNEIDFLTVKIKELEKQIATEDHNIQFGLSSNAHKLELERELKETSEQLRGKRQELNVLGGIYKDLERAVEIAGYEAGNPLTINRIVDSKEGELTNTYYRISKDTAIVTGVLFSNNSVVFKKEEILESQPTHLVESKLRVMAYVPASKMDKINNSTKAEVIINDDVSFTAAIAVFGSRTVEMPEHLRSNFSSTVTVPLAIFVPEDNQLLPFWAITANLPVKIRIRNINFDKNDDDVHIWLRTGKGLEEESRKRLIKTRHMGNLRSYSSKAAAPKRDTLAQVETKPENSRTPGKEEQSTKPAGPAEIQHHPQSGYYIIAGCFSVKQAAAEIAGKYGRDFKDTRILERNNKYYVTLAYFNNKADAEKRIPEIRKKTGVDVWVYTLK